LRKSALFLFSFFLALLLLMTSAAQAQTQTDLAVGASTVIGTKANNAGTEFFPQNAGGGIFPTASADFLFFKHLGIEGEIASRAERTLSQGFIPYRTTFYNFGAMYSPPLGKHAALEFSAGAGEELAHFYAPNLLRCPFFTCTDFTNTSHLLLAFGGGVRGYVWRQLFVRADVRFYHIDNNIEFSSNHATRVGVSIGYSFGRGKNATKPSH
jgi:hypothetical protein